MHPFVNHETRLMDIIEKHHKTCYTGSPLHLAILRPSEIDARKRATVGRRVLLMDIIEKSTRLMQNVLRNGVAKLLGGISTLPGLKNQ